MRAERNKNAKCFIDPLSRIDAHSKIGDYTYIGPLVDVTRAVIGRYCSVAPRVVIGMGEHDIDEISTSHVLSDKNSSYECLTVKDIEIGNDVWIGANAIIRRGVKIGNCAVVGAGSFVNKDVPDFAVVGGVPAKIIKFRFDAEKRNAISETKFWEYDPEEAKAKINDLEQMFEKEK